LFVRLRRFDEAIAAFNRALEVQPDCAEACYGKACCLANLGQIDHAIINLQAAIALAPSLKNVAQSDPLLAAIRGQDWFQVEVVG
jgi:tetratricopeptide (TPR) repeat protein